MKHFRALLCILLTMILLSAPALAAPSLSKGDRSAWVVALQLRLNQLGYSVGTADGDFGGKTASALQKFQTEKGLSVTGAADEATWAALYDEHVTIKSGGVPFDVKLTEPFTTIETNTEDGGNVVMGMDGVNAYILPVQATTLEDAVRQLSDVLNQIYEDAIPLYQASNNELTSETFDVGGRSAALVFNRFNLVNGKALTHYAWLGVLSVDADTMLRVEIGLNIENNAKIKSYYEDLFTNETVKNILAGIRWEGGESAVGTAAYEPVGDVNISDLLPLILKYVDVEAGYGKEITDAARVNLYYGAKAMDWFSRMVAAGNDRKDVLNEARLEIIVSAMDSELREAYSDLSEKYMSALFSLTNFEEADTKAALAEMGAPEITWTSDDIVDMLEWAINGFSSIK